MSYEGVGRFRYPVIHHGDTEGTEKCVATDNNDMSRFETQRDLRAISS
jgi:hypothetical protein